MAEDKSTVDQTHLSEDESNLDQDKKPNTRPFIRYTRAHLLRLSKSPHVTVPNGMPHFKDWFGEWGESSVATAKKESTSEALGQLPRDRARFRRDTEDGEGARETLSSGRPTFKGALSFSQASGSAMGSMGSFRHPSSRLESDARREEREREGRRETENLRNLSQQFDRERRDREAAPHLPRVVSGASSTNGRDPKSRDSAREPRDNAKEPSRDARRGRGDDTHDWRRAREDDRQRSRSRPRGKGDREPVNGSKRERDSWTTSEGRRGVAGRARNAAGDDRQDGKTKDERAASKHDRDKPPQEEEPAWMGDYVPEVGSRGILGSTRGEDDIQAWKRELKEKERAAQGIEADSLEDEGLGGLDDDVARMKLVEEQAKHHTLGQQEDDGLDEIQRFKKMMQESERQRREDAERKALELAGKAEPKQTTDQNQPIHDLVDTPATALPSPGPPGLAKPATEIESVPTPPVPETLETNGRVGGVSLGASNWPVSTTTTPSTSAATLSTPTWNQPGGPSTDSSSNPRLSPVQARRFTQDGAPADGAAVGTRSTSRFANFFGDKHREPSAPQFSNNTPPAPSHPPFMQGGNEPQLLDTLLARLAESQARPQAQPPQTQDRVFAQRNTSIPSQPQYGNTGPQNMANMQHAQPPLIQHQRAQLSMHQQQQQQQLLSSLNAGTLSGSPAGIHSLGHNGPSNYTQGVNVNSGIINPSLNLDIDGRFVSDGLVPGLRPRNGSVAFDEDFQVNPAAASMGRGAIQQHRPQQSFDALHRQQQQQAMYNMGGNRTPSGGFRNGPSPIGGHNPNPMQRGPDLPQYLSGMSNPLGGPGGAGGNANGPQQQYGNRLGAMNLGNMLGAGGQINQPRFDERQRIQQGQAIHHQPGQSLSGIGGLPLDFGLLQQQQPSQRQMPRGGMPGVGGYPMQQNQSQMGPRSTSGLLGGIGAQQYPGHMHNDFVVQPNQTTNANDIMAMFLAGQGNAGMGGA
ncbi:Zinc finger CCCH domain-containing protein 13 [Homo sapiens] [Rhizoctonia solani]|uniref:Zinc finger CCCH domain-containing protein 13 [Homo sapiens] n=1 Tax=Rhizoctonia solani TaxID=456999 RepID=A0A0K6GEJ0_9AGAM|nr:Zinc finger CCCH domain-containing protein 13 [Homo sapiens] [Rhizoctonia solani]